MKAILTGLIVISLVLSCKSDQSNSSTLSEPLELSVAQKIANAHGFENWERVTQVEFTFRVDRDSTQGSGRSWVWRPKERSVKLITDTQSISYNRSKIDSTQMAADQAFINDKFWMFIPFQLIWDKGLQISEVMEKEAPISKEKLSSITIIYPKEGGGYTPGDAYDIYFDKDYIIREWTFRKGNAEAATLSNTFETYKEVNGLKIAMEHKIPANLWNLNFSDVKITLD